MNWLQLDQRVCVVTGGAKGLGASIVQTLLTSGCRVAVLPQRRLHPRWSARGCL